MAPRSIQLRTRSSIGHYRPSNLDPPPYNPLSSIRDTQPYSPSDLRPPYDPLSSIQPPAAPVNYEPGGGETPYDPLTSISTGRPYGEAGYAMPAWTPPTPPPRPGGLGQVLSKAVARPGTSRSQAQGQQQAQVQPLTTNDLFGTVQLNPNQRNAPIYTALNVGSLFGGGGAPAPQPAAQSVAGSPATAGGRTALRPPSNSGDWTYDEEGNLVPVYPNVNQTSGEVSQAVSKPGWFRRLG